MKNFIAVTALLVLSGFGSKACSKTQKDTAVPFASVHGTVFSMTSVGNVLYIAGAFDSVGGIAANNVACWDSTGWKPVGAGVHGEVRALSDDGHGGLYTGGKFDSAGSVAASNVAHWDGSSWTALGAGANDTVFTFSRLADTLYCGGSFTMVDTLHALRLAKWGNIEGWGLVAFHVDSGSVRAIGAAYSAYGALYYGGTFSSPPIYSISYLRNCAVYAGYHFLNEEYIPTWYICLSEVAESLNGTVLGMALRDTRRLLVCGDFDTLGGKFMPAVALYDGIGWRSLFSAKGIASACCWLDRDAFFSILSESQHSQIFRYLYSDSILAQFQLSPNTASASGEVWTLTVTNDSNSNAALDFQECWSGSGSQGADCYTGCDYDDQVPPGITKTFSTTFSKHEPYWSIVGAIIDNSTNSGDDPRHISAAGGPVSFVDTSNQSNMNPLVVTESGGSIILSRSAPAMTGRLRIYDVLGQRLIDLPLGLDETTIVPVKNVHGVLFVLVQSGDQVVVKKIVLE